jgi:hypothetical protein
LFRPDVALWDWRDLCDIVQRLEALADTPFLFCRCIGKLRRVWGALEGGVESRFETARDALVVDAAL